MGDALVAVTLGFHPASLAQPSGPQGFSRNEPIPCCATSSDWAARNTLASFPQASARNAAWRLSGCPWLALTAANARCHCSAVRAWLCDEDATVSLPPLRAENDVDSDNFVIWG